MKSIFTKASLFLLVIVILASCGKDDPAPAASLVGTWTVTGSSLNMMVNGKSLKDYLISTGMTASDAQAAVDELTSGLDIDATGIVFDFKADGTYTEKDSPTDTYTGKWTKSTDGKTLTLTDDDDATDTTNATITSLTATELKLDITVGSDDSSGFKIDYTISVTAKKS